MRQITIVKVGGAVVEDPLRLSRLLQSFAALDGPKMLVHGGGREATRVAAQLGVETHMVDGRRITDGDMLRVVTMVYGGLVNKNLVAQLQAMGVDALGLTGADAGLIRSHRRPVKNGLDYGFVGDVDQADGVRLTQLVDMGLTPVVAPLTHDGQGQLLNTNADTIAAETAKAMARQGFDVTLVYAFEKPGVLRQADDDHSVIGHIGRGDFERLRADGTISGGMLPKIENALRAVEDGVGRVRITHSSDLQGIHGTEIS